MLWSHLLYLSSVGFLLVTYLFVCIFISFFLLWCYLFNPLIPFSPFIWFYLHCTTSLFESLVSPSIFYLCFPFIDGLVICFLPTWYLIWFFWVGFAAFTFICFKSFIYFKGLIYIMNWFSLSISSILHFILFMLSMLLMFLLIPYFPIQFFSIWFQFSISTFSFHFSCAFFIWMVFNFIDFG